MPELPEVETTRRGVTPHLLGEQVTGVEVRQPKLRWPVPADLSEKLKGARLSSIERRAKYLLFQFKRRSAVCGTLIVHLGMSGSLRITTIDEPLQKHDHIDIRFGKGKSAKLMRYSDPRRFGA
ncbi:MAG: DNA-formamidopyrimidine glycosylase, partial [Gammaproteobacteria bacterium]|nr:DNA-formamidopyrimidine glycosylase [Gammaproteobacteria bacterium]